MVVAQERIAAEIGRDVLTRGGNAIDAAVATGFAMAVTYPRAGNIGGGGFMIVHLANSGQDIAIDYRESAPAAATRDMFLGNDGKPDPKNLAIRPSASVSPALSPAFRSHWKNMAPANSSFPICLHRLSRWRATASTVADDIAGTLPELRDRLNRWPSSRRSFLPAGRHITAARATSSFSATLAATLRGNFRAGATRLL